MTTSIYQSSTLEKRRNNFKTKAELKHNFRYKYPFLEEEYETSNKPITIHCEKHGNFPQTPNNHLAGNGCRKCYNESLTSNTGEFITKAKIIHDGLYLYPNTVYIGSDEYVDIECKVHGNFSQTSNNHLAGQDCPRCSNYKGYSKMAIEWLNSLNNPNIQHAENGGEYKIIKEDSTFYKADGYDKGSNTVYEFHGDVYHGNPDLFESDSHCHPFDNKVTAGELYQNTIGRENEIKSLGYNLIVMWESDFI